MIQRIQTVFLLLTAILMGVTIICPLLEIYDGQKFVLEFRSLGFTRLVSIEKMTWGVLFFTILSVLAPLVNIFMYKSRKRQITIGWITSLFIVLYYITAGVYFMSYIGLDAEGISIQLGIILPLLALIFNILAISRIKKDEKLVKSLDRIR